MSFTLAQLLSAVRREDGVISAETSGYVALALAEQALDGRSWDENSVCLEAAGTLTVHRNDAPATRVSQRAVLSWLLSRASGENLALAACCRAQFNDDAAWVSALRSALVPLNRAAAKRALMRLHRRLEALGEERLTAHVAAERAAFTRELLLPVAPLVEQSLLSTPGADHEQREPTATPVANVKEAPTEAWDALKLQEYTPRVLPVEVSPRWRSEDTPQLSSFAVELRVPLADPELPRNNAEGDETRALWFCAAPSMNSEPSLAGMVVAPEPDAVWAAPCNDQVPADELTEPEAVNSCEREPGLGQVLGRKSDVSELLTSFRVGSLLTEGELLAALRHSVDSQGTPLPPRMAVARRASRR